MSPPRGDLVHEPVGPAIASSSRAKQSSERTHLEHHQHRDRRGRTRPQVAGARNRPPATGYRGTARKPHDVTRRGQRPGAQSDCPFGTPRAVRPVARPDLRYTASTHTRPRHARHHSHSRVRTRAESRIVSARPASHLAPCAAVSRFGSAAPHRRTDQQRGHHRTFARIDSAVRCRLLVTACSRAAHAAAEAQTDIDRVLGW